MANEAERTRGWKFHGMKTAHLLMSDRATVCNKNVYPAAGAALALAIGPRCKTCRKAFAVQFGEAEAAKTDPTETAPTKPVNPAHRCPRPGCENGRAFGRALCSAHHAEVYQADARQ